jgi:DDE superfamily endonuclease
MEEGDLAAGKRTAAALGGWIVFEDETGQRMKPPRSRTWGPARHHPRHPRARRRDWIGLGSRPGLLPPRAPHPADLPDARLPRPQGRDQGLHLDGEYRDLLTAAHYQLPGGNIVLVWDNLNVHLRPELRAFTAAQPWLEVFQLPPYAPDLNPCEGIWSSLKRGPLANVSFTGFAHLLQVIRHGLKKIQYQPGLIDGCLTGTGLSLQPDQPTS